MNTIAGIIDFEKNLLSYKAYNRLLVRSMVRAFPNTQADSEQIGEHIALANSCSVIKKTVEGHEFVISLTGEIYNSEHLKNKLSKYGYTFTDSSDAEIILFLYIHYGSDCCKMIDGTYCFAVWDSMRQQAFICRDKMGTYPLYYAEFNGAVFFSCDEEALFEYPDFSPRTDKNGLCELFLNYPNVSPGISIFKDISQICAASFIKVSRSGIVSEKYWHPEITNHSDSCEKTAKKLSSLISASSQNILSKNSNSEIFLCCDGADIIFDDRMNFDPFENADKKINALKPIIAETLDIPSYISMKRSEAENSSSISDAYKKHWYLRSEREFDTVNKKAYHMSNGDFLIKSPFSDSKIFQYALNIPPSMKKNIKKDFPPFFCQEKKISEFNNKISGIFEDKSSALALFYDRRNSLLYPEIFSSLSAVNDFFMKFTPSIV